MRHCLRTITTDRGHPEAVEQRHGRADQQNEAGPAEHHHLPEGRVQETDASCGTHSGRGRQEHAGCRGPSKSQGKFSQARAPLMDC